MAQGFFDFDDNEGRKRRDEGMERVKRNATAAWRKKFEEAVLTMIARQVDFHPEDVRILSGNPPYHPNAFSSMWNSVLRRKWIEWTGKFTPCQRASSHVRGGGLKLYRGTGRV